MLLEHNQVSCDRILDVGSGLLNGLALTHATRKRRNVGDISLVIRIEGEYHLEVHVPILARPGMRPEAVGR